MSPKATGSVGKSFNRMELRAKWRIIPFYHELIFKHGDLLIGASVHPAVAKKLHDESISRNKHKRAASLIISSVSQNWSAKETSTGNRSEELGGKPGGA